MKKVLCIVNLMEPGGAETFLMKIFRSLDRDKYSIDFITSINKKGYYDDEIKQLGGKIYNMPNLKRNPIKSMLMLYKVIKNNNYNAVVLSTAASVYAVLLIVAKMAGVKTGLRSTNSNLPDKNKKLKILHKAFSFLPKCIVDVKLAPSKLAADFMFGRDDDINKVKILKNAIPISVYKFRKIERDKVRRKLNIDENTLLIGHVGRFEQQKNHEFIIKIFNKIRERYDAKLILIGQGSLENDIRNLVGSMDIVNDVLFLGIRKDVPQLMMGMDGMIFPSLYEGLPNVIIESQATGLPCLLSDNITAECRITDQVEFLSLSENEGVWASKFIDMVEKTHNREMYNNKVKESGYDINNVKNEFINMFLENNVY